MARNGLVSRIFRVFGLMMVLVIVGSLLMACGEEEDLSGGSGRGSDPPASTPTPSPVPPTATPEPPTATPTPQIPIIEYEKGRDSLVLRVEYQGGFMMMQHLLTRMPVVTLTGDGCFVYEGPQIMIYPPPALPNLLTTCVNDEAMQAILQEAKDAGLLDGNAHYPVDVIADAATTVFTISADGNTYVISAYALSEDELLTPDVSEEDAAARAKLAAFLSKMRDVRSWLPQGSIVSEERFYEIDRMQIVAQPVSSPHAPIAPDDIDTGEIAWPLPTGLAEFGETFLDNDDLRCGVIEGDDLGLFLRVIENANQLTTWSSDGEGYILYLRPLMTGEPGCAIEYPN